MKIKLFIIRNLEFSDNEIFSCYIKEAWNQDNHIIMVKIMINFL